MKPAIVFDLDGTLIDSAPDIMGIANAILTARDLPPLTLGETISFIGNGASVLVEKMRGARGIDDAQHEAILAKFLSSYESAVTLTQPYPGAVAALEALKDAGFALGICTNKPVAPARHVIAHLGLDGFFDVVLGGDSLPVRKPDPEPLHAAFRALGIDTGLYVGDSEVDAATAQAAGVPFVLFTEGYRKSPLSEVPHTVAFDDFAALPGLIDATLAKPA